MIRFERVEARYHRSPVAVLRGVDLSAPPGSITAVVGPNGSGKSTLVRALLRRVPISAGAITIDGQPLAELGAPALARRVAVVGQREEAVFPIRVQEYIALGRHPHLGTWRGLAAADEDAVRRAAERAGVEELNDRFTDQLSGGEWQRVRLARALAQDTPALVLDEPTTFLDIGHEMALFERLAALAAGGHAVLLVSHDLDLVARFAHTIVLLHHGVVAASGAVDDVMRADVLERVYEWPLIVTRDPAVGAPSVTPLRAPR